jgi:hypothetical protein
MRTYGREWLGCDPALEADEVTDREPAVAAV